MGHGQYHQSDTGEIKQQMSIWARKGNYKAVDRKV